MASFIRIVLAVSLLPDWQLGGLVGELVACG